MNDISNNISLYHNLFLICLVLALVCFVVAVVLFFVLDIKTTLGYLTGRSAKKKIKELETTTALSGRLTGRERSNMQYVAQEMKDDMGVRQKAKPGIRKVEHVVEAAVPKTAEIPTASVETDVLRPAVSAETDVLRPAEQGTEVLKDNAVVEAVNVMEQSASTELLSNTTGQRGKFVIVREIMFIHTEEVI